MQITKIKLNNFRCFKEKEVDLTKNTFLCGDNGSGKSTIALYSVLFGCWGYVHKLTLDSLLFNNNSKSLSVEITVQNNDTIVQIIRQYPTKIEIYENNNKLKLSNTEAQNYIDHFMGSKENFLKFHIIDSKAGNNFLDEGQTSLKRILFANNDKLFNNLRKKLTEIKHDREIFNIDTAHVSKHYPSEDRLETLEVGLQELEPTMTETNKKLLPLEQKYIKIKSKQNTLSSESSQWEIKERTIKRNNKCYACKRGLDDKQQQEMLLLISSKIEDIDIQLAEIDTENLIQEINNLKLNKDKINEKIYKIRTLISKLKQRIEQKDYKYNNKDVYIAKEAISEVDRLSSYYISQSLQNLTPIINNITKKIGIEINFNVDKKNNFVIQASINNNNYDYKQLSTGQQLIVQIALKLAILMERNEGGVIICDEGFATLSQKNLLLIIEMFNNLPFQLLMCLHRFNNVPTYMKLIELKGE